MGKDVDLSDDRSTDRRTVTDEYFEREVYLSREQTAAFLRDLADSIEEDTTVTVSGDGWTIPFEYREPIEVEVEFTSRYEKELEIELEFDAPKGGGEFAVE
jgi:amphi-Trp domain-containing protein